LTLGAAACDTSSVSPFLLALKALVYFGVLALGVRRWGATLANKRRRVILGGLARFALGWIVGIPAGLLVRGWLPYDSQVAFYGIFFAIRFLLWLLVLRVAFRKAPLGEVAGLAAAGTLVNAALDLALPDSLFGMFRLNMC
jgi:hypothetical protein